MASDRVCVQRGGVGWVLVFEEGVNGGTDCLRMPGSRKKCGRQLKGWGGVKYSPEREGAPQGSEVQPCKQAQEPSTHQCPLCLELYCVNAGQEEGFGCCCGSSLGLSIAR